MKDSIVHFLDNMGIPTTPLVQLVVMLAVIAIVGVVIYAIMLYGLWGMVKRHNRRRPRHWLTLLIDSNIFTLLVMMVQGAIVNVQVGLWIPRSSGVYGFLDVATRLWFTVFAMLALFAAVNIGSAVVQRTRIAQKLPVNGIAQALKLIILVIFVILIASVLMDRSPALLLSGLSAMTAVTMLIFKDPIMGFVSGLQLSGYNLLAVGDWVEMPKYNADGDVIEIGLTTVKVQNWDKTIVTIPTYALVSDSFKNWRGMAQSGGRRIKRSVYIDITSIHFLTDEEHERLSRAHLISEYLGRKSAELESYNHDLGVDLTSPVNGRHLTNVGTFRAYLESYLRANPNIHKGLTIMVRQLASTAEGLPIEIYAFTSTTAWDDYERIQSDIFDHVFAVLPEFGLRAYQAPSGSDFRALGAAQN